MIHFQDFEIEITKHQLSNINAKILCRHSSWMKCTNAYCPFLMGVLYLNVYVCEW